MTFFFTIFFYKGTEYQFCTKGNNCGKGKLHCPDCDTNDNDLVIKSFFFLTLGYEVKNNVVVSIV